MRAVVAAAALALLAGCASTPRSGPPDPRDPFESFNRPVAAFNDNVDRAVLKPVATAYRDTVPYLVRAGVGNFFANLNELWYFVNNVLQAKPQGAAESWMRFNVNTFFGLGGLFDVASEMNIDRHPEDFGQTLGRWGVPSGPYVVLPLFGPSTVRDTAVFPIDRVGEPLFYLDPAGWSYGLTVLRLVDTRSSLLRASSVLDAAALDKYTFTRDAYLQKRRADVFDSTPPRGRNRLEGDSNSVPGASIGAPPVDDPATPPSNSADTSLQPAPKP